MHAHAGEDLLTPSHVTTTAVALTGGRAERIWGQVAFSRLIRASHKGDHRIHVTYRGSGRAMALPCLRTCNNGDGGYLGS